MSPSLTTVCGKCSLAPPDAPAIVRHLRLAGHQVTPPRAAVVRAVAAQTRPFTAAQLGAAIATATPGIGRATVFRAIDLLVSAGVLDRVHALPAARYVVRDIHRAAQRHWYFVCGTCEGVSAIPEEAPGTAAGLSLDGALGATARRHGFRVESTQVEILGRCPAC